MSQSRDNYDRQERTELAEAGRGLWRLGLVAVLAGALTGAVRGGFRLVLRAAVIGGILGACLRLEPSLVPR